MTSVIKNLVTGGAGFIGSNLINRLLKNGEEVICLDNFVTGKKENLIHFRSNPRLKIINHDINNYINIKADKIWHLACSASPKSYYRNPIFTSKTNYIGTLNMLELAIRMNSKFLLASSSEVYGEPEIHPQIESYKGSVNNIGIRSCYDEGKRIAESLCFDFYRQHKCDIKIARIFNTYGPLMKTNDGRVISNFIIQGLTNKRLTIYGTGMQTRSFCYIDDLIEALILLMNSNITGPINLGNPFELRILDLANIIRLKINKDLNIIFEELPIGDPTRRKPSIELAKKELNWEPKISLDQGINKTIDFFKKYINF